MVMVSLINFSRVLLFLCLLSLGSTKASSQLLAHNCPDTPTYTANSTYETNLNNLFDLFSFGSPIGYSQLNAGGSSSEVVHGFFLCRGDVPNDICRDCVVEATKEAVQKCPRRRVTLLFYDNCLLHYSDHSVPLPDQSILAAFYNVENVTNRNRFREVLGKTMDDLESRAAIVQSGRMFATKEADVPADGTLFALAQCRPDLDSNGCQSCLRDAISNLSSCCEGKRGARAVFPSCFVRYELYPFYYTNVPVPVPAVAVPPPPPTTTGPASSPGRHEKQGKTTSITISVSVSTFIVVTLLGGCFYYSRRKRIEREEEENREEFPLHLSGVRLSEDCNSENLQGEQLTHQDFPSIQLDLIHAATQHFSQENKLGEGGFGPVYKGTLPDGKEIAVKRLSKTSGQGLHEFKNEVILIARLQHWNLVRLLGCCLEGNELLLIYEYMPNKSLDVFLFDSTRGTQLDWKTRLNIINGIARGLLYLHEDSRLRIIHRDLKASNILLDHEMNPKISDFGMARIFGRNQSVANTNRVVGTYGYMAPEYAMEGLFSVKSDIFSFGVLLLEIVSGKRNGGFYLSEHGHSLLSFAWKLWSEGHGLELMDPLLVQSCVAVEVLKCIHIGLLCVQEDPADRPIMSSIVFMLASSDTVTIPQPTQPAFSVGRLVLKSTQSSSNVNTHSINEVTVTEVSAR